MKKQRIHNKFNCKNFGFLTVLFFLFCFSVSKAGDNDPGKESIGVFINDKQINMDKEGLEITAKGILSLSSMAPTQKKNVLGFRIVVRHRFFVGHDILGKEIIGTEDERYNDGEEFDRIEIEKILLKAKVWDQIIIIPVDHDSVYENSRTHFQIDVIADKC